jgi:hypothetical protein
MRDHVRWLVQDAVLPPNFIAELSDDVRARVFQERSAQSRIRMLVRLCPNVPIPREAFCTVALNKNDPMRRLRRDKYRPDPLGGMLLLSAKYGRKELLRRGLAVPPPDHWVAVPE